MEAVTTPPEVAAALSVLNAHARAHGCGRDAVYTYKAFAALLNAALEERPKCGPKLTMNG